MINLALRSEYSFQQTFAHLDHLVKGDERAVGIADLNNTFAHVKFQQLCDKKKVKPIFGVRLSVVKSVSERVKKDGWQYLFTAKNNDGLKEIYGLVKKAYDNFYYKPRIGLVDVWVLSDNIYVISDDFELDERIDFVALTTTTNLKCIDNDIPKVYINNNNYINAWERKYYEILANDRSRYIQTYPQHILSKKEFERMYHNYDALLNTNAISVNCNARIEKAEMVKYRGSSNDLVTPNNKQLLRDLCYKGAEERGVGLQNKLYRDRLERELKLIEEKDFSDYFLITADMIIKAKKTMLVGPSRGSSAGSLVCYLTYITEVDPIKFGLIFERFIDINRSDLPDIDVDFPDKKRNVVIKNLIQDNGRDNVRHIANINRLKPKSAIGRFAQAIRISKYETEAVKDAIIERSGGDARSAMCIQDTFESTEVGKEFIEKYPNMKYVSEFENHASHAGVHAAGIIVCSEPLQNYGGVNAKDDIIMMDKKDAEHLNLLKIDCLGLRTLSVLGDCAKYANFDFKKFYSLPLDDEKVFDIFNKSRFHGIFQFEGYSLQSITKGMGVHSFNDIVAITSLARPGALHSGGATRYVKLSNGNDQPKYYGDIHKSIVGETFGIVLYQEQMMNIAKEVGNLNWEDVSSLRKAASKSLGDEFFNKYKEKFMKGAIEKNELPDDHAEALWSDICHCGSWIFNKCLSGDTKVILSSPGCYMERETTIKELYRMYKVEPKPYVKKRMNKGIGPKLISLHPDERCRPQNAVDIIYVGVKKVFRYTFSDGTEIKCTPDHKFIINDEWAPIKSATIWDSFTIGEYEKTKRESTKHLVGAGKINNGIDNKGESNPSYINGVSMHTSEQQDIARLEETKCEDCNSTHDRMEVHHNDFNSGYDNPKDTSILCPGCHKKRHYKNGRVKIWGKGYQTSKIELIHIEEIGFEDVYDIEMPEHHNFLLEGGIITHNSHAVSYGFISYWTAWCKAYHPLEFTIANLNNARDEKSAVKILRDAVKYDGVEYVAIDPVESQEHWTVRDGKLLGGLTSIKGIGASKANDIIRKRDKGIEQTPSIAKKLANPKTIFSILFPCDYHWGDMYSNYSDYGLRLPPVNIESIQAVKGDYIFIGLLSDKNLRDLNEYQSVVKRGGKIIENDTLFLNLTFEDDTDSIMATIDRYNYERIGRQISEKGIIGGHWYLIKGKIKNEWRRVVINDIINLNEHIGLKEV